MSATKKQIEFLDSLVNEIDDIVNEAKKSPNYNKYKHMIVRALSGVETVVEKARKSGGDKAAYSTAIGMLLRRKKFVQNYVR